MLDGRLITLKNLRAGPSLARGERQQPTSGSQSCRLAGSVSRLAKGSVAAVQEPYPFAPLGELMFLRLPLALGFLARLGPAEFLRLRLQAVWAVRCAPLASLGHLFSITFFLAAVSFSDRCRCLASLNLRSISYFSPRPSLALRLKTVRQWLKE